MRLSFRLVLCVGVMLVMFFSIQPAVAKPGEPEAFPDVQAPGSSVVFEHLTIEDGLSQNAGLALLQDHQGFLWIGTQDGLNRYNGYDFKIFKHNPDDPSSISYNSIISLYEDQQNNLWVGTWGGGLNRYDPKTGSFSRYEADPSVPDRLSHGMVSSLAEDANGNIWVGTGGGLDLLDPATGEFSHFSKSYGAASLNDTAIGALLFDGQGNLWIGTGAYGIPGTGLFLLGRGSQQVRQVALSCSSAGNISSIVQDRNGILWIAHGGYSLSGGGLTRYDPANSSCFNFTRDPSDQFSLGDDNVAGLYLDADGWLWITTYGGGLHRMDTQAPGSFYPYRNIPGDTSSLSSDDVYSIMQDRSGILWIGSLTSGINKLKLRTLQFGLYRNNPADPTSLASDKIGAFAEDWIGNIWVGTWGAGLERFNPYTGRFTHYKNAADDLGTISSDVILSLASDDSGGLWVGTLGGGLDYLDIKRNTFTHYRNQAWDLSSLINDNVVSLLLDQNGNLWVGTLGGLDRFDAPTGEFIHYQSDPSADRAISHPAAVSLFVDTDNILWVGTWGGGLNRLDLNEPDSFNPSLARFEHYAAEPENPSSLSDNSIFVIHQSKESGILWLGTQGGLNKFDPQTGIFKTYREKDGLRNTTILGILEDDEGYLWLTTNNGMAKFNPLTETFRIFDRSDGLQSNEFNSNAYYKSSTGLFYVGGIHGFNVFDPLKIEANPVPPEIVVTDFKIFNEPVQVDLSGAETMTLIHSQNFIAFDFAALDYHAPQKNQYAYMLEGLDEDWIQAGTRRYASYTNLDGGEYVFHVKGANSDGTWNEAGVSIPITVIPPFWQTWWFMSAVGFSLAGAMAIGFQWRVQAIKADARRQENLVAQRTSQLRETNDQLEIEIEQRKRAEESLSRRAAKELDQSEARFRTMFETSGVGIGIMGLDRKVIEANPALCQMYGYTSEELVGQASALVTHPDDLPRSMQHLQDLLDGKYNHYTDERRYIRKNGEIFWAQITMSMVRDSQGNPLYIVGMLTDITEKKQMLEDLRQSEGRFKTLYDYAEMGIVIANLDENAGSNLDEGTFQRLIAHQRFNPALQRMFGYSETELQNMDVTTLIYPEDRGLDAELSHELFAGERDSYQIDKRYVRKDGSIFWGRLNYSLARSVNGRPHMAIGIIEDIDEQKRASERLAAQEAVHRRTLEQRIAERTQELNKANELLQQKAAQEAVAAERTRLARDLHDAVTQTLFSATLIADVLPDIWQMNMTEGRRRLEELRQLTRGALAEMRTLLVELRPNALVEVPLSTLLRQLSEALTGRSRIDIQFSFEGDRKLPPDVQVALYRIAQEALNNVVKHSKATQAAIMLRLGEQVRLSVTDNGAGFDPTGVTADHLGLKIMSERCDAIHAKFSLYSEPGEGTQVTITWQD